MNNLTICSSIGAKVFLSLEKEVTSNSNHIKRQEGSIVNTLGLSTQTTRQIDYVLADVGRIRVELEALIVSGVVGLRIAFWGKFLEIFGELPQTSKLYITYQDMDKIVKEISPLGKEMVEVVQGSIISHGIGHVYLDELNIPRENDSKPLSLFSRIGLVREVLRLMDRNVVMRLLFDEGKFTRLLVGQALSGGDHEQLDNPIKYC